MADRLYFLRVKHHVLAVSDQCPRCLHVTLRRIIGKVSGKGFRQDLCRFPLISDKRKCRLSDHLRIPLYDLRADAVDCTKFQCFCRFLTKHGVVPLPHVPCCGNRIGKRQHVFWSYPPHHKQIPQPRNENGCLPTPWDGKQEHRFFQSRHAGKLLRAQLLCVFLYKFFFFHS